MTAHRHCFVESSTQTVVECIQLRTVMHRLTRSIVQHSNSRSNTIVCSSSSTFCRIPSSASSSSASSRTFHISAASTRLQAVHCRSIHSTACISTSSSATSAPISSAASEPLDADTMLAHTYFPFNTTASTPARFPVPQHVHFPGLCRIGFGGTPRPANISADASAAVRAYIRLGGNFVDLTRGFSLDMIEAFKDLIRTNRISGDILLCASVSSADILAFVASEQERWTRAQRRRGGTAASSSSSSSPSAASSTFVSTLYPPGSSPPTTAAELLPHLPTILPQFMRFFLDLHELPAIDCILFEPPLLNLNASTVPDEAYEWMGGVDRDFRTQQSFHTLLEQWFTALENEVQEGRITSYGLCTSRMTMPPMMETTNEQHSPQKNPLFFPVERVIQIAKDAVVKVNPAASPEEHHLSTLKFPFSLLTAYRLLYSSHQSFLSTARSNSLLLLGDTPFDDTLTQQGEFLRFQEVDAPTDQEVNQILPHYREAQAKVQAMEQEYKVMYNQLSQEEQSTLPARIPHASWASLIDTKQNDIYNLTSFESLLHQRIKPSLKRASLGISHTNQQLVEWYKMYVKELPKVLKYFQQAIEHTTGKMNVQINEMLARSCPEKLGEFKTLDEKTLLILLSIQDIQVLLTDQTDACDRFAHTLVRLYNEQPEKHPAPSSPDAIPTITKVLQPYLLTQEELHTVLKMLHTHVPALLPEGVMKDKSRRRKPLVGF